MQHGNDLTTIVKKALVELRNGVEQAVVEATEHRRTSPAGSQGLANDLQSEFEQIRKQWVEQRTRSLLEDVASTLVVECEEVLLSEKQKASAKIKMDRPVPADEFIEQLVRLGFGKEERDGEVELEFDGQSMTVPLGAPLPPRMTNSILRKAGRIIKKPLFVQAERPLQIGVGRQ